MNEWERIPLNAKTQNGTDAQPQIKALCAQRAPRPLCGFAALRQLLRHFKLALRPHATCATRCWVRVRGASMTPALRPGDQVLVDFTRRWACGDVVVVGAARALVVHRIVAVSGAGDGCEVITQGDAVGRGDRPVRAGAIVGVVVRVRRRRWWGRWQEWEAARALE